VIPDVTGNDLEGVISFRDIFDVNKMLSYSRIYQKAVVLGGGLLGFRKRLNGLVLRGMDVTVVHNHAVLLNRQMDKPAGDLLQAELEQKGIKFKMAAKITEPTR